MVSDLQQQRCRKDDGDEALFIYIRCYGPNRDVCDAPSSTVLHYTVLWLLYVFGLWAASHECT